MVISKLIFEFLVLIGGIIVATATAAFAYATFQYSLNIQSMQLKFDKKVQKNIDANSAKIDNLIDSFNKLVKELKLENSIQNEIVIEDANDDRTEWNL